MSIVFDTYNYKYIFLIYIYKQNTKNKTGDAF